MAQINQGQDKIIRVPLIGEVTARDTSTSTDQRFVNCYPEVIYNPTESYNPNRKIYLIKRPGLKNTNGTFTTGVGRGVTEFNGNIYAVVGATLYQVVLGGAWINSGTLTTSSGVCTFTNIDGSAKALVINDMTGIYTLDTNNNFNKVGNLAKTLTAASWTSGVMTWTTSTSHTFNAGDTVTIAGCNVGNGTYNIQSVPSPTQFTVNIASSPGTVSTFGTVTRTCGLPATIQPGLCYLDGYLFVMDSNANIYNSYVQDATDWQALSFLQAEVQPDGGVGINVYRNQVVAWGTRTVEFFSDVGSTTSTNTSVGSPLQRTLGGAGSIPLGCAAPNSIVYADQTYYWIVRDVSGGHSVAQLDGFNAKMISRPPFDRLLDAEGANLANAICFHIKQAGHSFYVVQLSSRTLVLDITDGSWTEWTSSNGKFQCASGTELNGVAYLQDTTLGNVYIFDPYTYQDNGVNFTVTLQTNRIDFDTSKRKFLRSIEVIGDQINTTCYIQWCNDDYKTWSTLRACDLSAFRAQLTNFGQFRRRAFRLTHTDNTPLRLQAIDFNIDLGGN